MPYNPPAVRDLIAQAQGDVTASDLTGADGTLPFGILAILVIIQARMAAGHYDNIAYAFRQCTPFTATDEWLEAWAALKRVYRKDATKAGYDGNSTSTFSGAVGTVLPANTPVQRADGFAYLTLSEGAVGSGGAVTVPLVALTTGALGNIAAGAVLTLGTSITGIGSTGTTSTGITGGTEQESDDDLRTRMLFAYANPPAGGSETDYVSWTLAIPGVTRAWCEPNGMGLGTVVVRFMMDNAEASAGGFPQGVNGVAGAEARDTPATGDQLTVANALYSLRPATSLLYACAPIEVDVPYAVTELSPNTQVVQDGIGTALQAMHLRKASPGGTLYPSDWNEAVAQVPSIEHFAMSPTTAFTAPAGCLPTVGTPTFAS